MRLRTGFVHVDSAHEKPSLYHANMAAMMFDKKQLKATRALNPLFALESDKQLEMAVCSCSGTAGPMSSPGALQAIQGSLRLNCKKEMQQILEVPLKKASAFVGSRAVV